MELWSLLMVSRLLQTKTMLLLNFAVFLDRTKFFESGKICISQFDKQYVIQTVLQTFAVYSQAPERSSGYVLVVSDLALMVRVGSDHTENLTNVYLFFESFLKYTYFNIYFIEKRLFIWLDFQKNFLNRNMKSNPFLFSNNFRYKNNFSPLWCAIFGTSGAWELIINAPDNYCKLYTH